MAMENCTSLVNDVQNLSLQAMELMKNHSTFKLIGKIGPMIEEGRDIMKKLPMVKAELKSLNPDEVSELVRLVYSMVQAVVAAYPAQIP